MDVWSALWEVFKIGLSVFLGYRFGLRSTSLRWELERASKTRDERRRLIEQARIHLRQIQQEIERNEGLYFTRDSEPRISTEIRTAIFSLGDGPLIEGFYSGQHSLRELAWGNDRKSSGAKLKPDLDAMLSRLGQLEAELQRAPQKG